MLEKTTRVNMLYDFYQNLLTSKQKEYMELYYREDYSLGEIASSSNVSRQAVYDTIKRTEQLLETYEKKLQLYKKYLSRNELLSELKQLIGNDKNNVTQAIIVIEQLQNLD